MATKYEIVLTRTAEDAYSRIFREAQPLVTSGDNSHPKVKLLRIIDECLDTIIPADPLNPKRALTGALSGIFRIKKGRLRVCYVCSSKKHAITVLYISETLRKEGDRNDPYQILTKMVMAGQFDQVFGELGIKKP